MYESFFGLNDRPFAATPVVKHYFPGRTIESARQTLSRCIDRAEGVGLLLGPAGTGKSLLCQVLAEQFRSRYQVALLDSGRLCTRRALLQAILFEIGLPYRDMAEGDLRLSLVDHLSSRATASQPGGAILLLVDESHSLPTRLLEELRLLSNLVRHGQPRVRLVLSGGNQFEERLTSPKLQSFNQRISARCYLEALDRSQTTEYVRRQIEHVGGKGEGLFPADALNAIFEASDGIPRLINQICDHAMLLAFANGQRNVSADGIQEAWASLQQLPTPWTAAPEVTSGASVPDVIEFGELDDMAREELPPAVPFRPTIDAVKQHDAVIKEPLARETIRHQIGRVGTQLMDPNINLLDNDFEEEEVVIDPYASLAPALANRPFVTSVEGHELGTLLAPFAAPTASPALTLRAIPSARASTVVEGMESPKSTMSRDHTSPALWRHVPQLQSQPYHPAPAAEAVTILPHNASDTNVDVSRPKSTPTMPHWDEDLIVIEEPPLAKPENVPPELHRANRQEYRKLFATLRGMDVTQETTSN
jgi:type II secretory pathway predicted ATPase ExeA